ncbi:MAG: DUF1893 domain-containing protein [Bacteroidales bacterium]|nr:DUF1893 domain-containing protein [Bacteroidales bacterium]
MATECSLVICDTEGVCHSFHRRGVADLYELVTTRPELLRGAAVADKVIGKGAAALMCIGGVRSVWSGVMSRGAADLFADAGIEASCSTLTGHIINRAGTGICPVEQLCAEATSPEECLPLISKFLESVKQKQN